MIYPPELEAILERPNTTDERKYSRLDVIDAYNLMKQQADGMQLERDIQQELAMKAREAGRREGLEEFAQRAEGFTAPWYSPEEIAAIVRIYVEDMQRKALIDLPKAEGETK